MSVDQLYPPDELVSLTISRPKSQDLFRWCVQHISKQLSCFAISLKTVLEWCLTKMI